MDRRHPDFNGGSVKVFIALRMLRNEHHQMDSLCRVLEGWEAVPRPGAGAPDAENPLNELIGQLQERLERHSRIEETVLFPRAMALEKALYDTAISGKESPVPG